MTKAMEFETCPDCKAKYTAGCRHTCRSTKCAFCEKEIDEAAWCISFGNSPLLGYEAVDQVCPDCILDGFAELDEWRARGRAAGLPLDPHPFECKGCPDCQGDQAGPLA